MAGFSLPIFKFFVLEYHFNANISTEGKNKTLSNQNDFNSMMSSLVSKLPFLIGEI